MHKKCLICRFRISNECTFKEGKPDSVDECRVHLSYADWDQIARTKKEKEKLALQHRLDEKKEME